MWCYLKRSLRRRSVIDEIVAQNNIIGHQNGFRSLVHTVSEWVNLNAMQLMKTGHTESNLDHQQLWQVMNSTRMQLRRKSELGELIDRYAELKEIVVRNLRNIILKNIHVMRQLTTRLLSCFHQTYENPRRRLEMKLVSTENGSMR